MDADEALQMFFDEEDTNVPIARFSDSDLPKNDDGDDVELTPTTGPAILPPLTRKPPAQTRKISMEGALTEKAGQSPRVMMITLLIWTTLLPQNGLKLDFLGSLISQLSKYMVLPIYKSEWL